MKIIRMKLRSGKSPCANCVKKPDTRLAKDGELIALGDYFSSPGFTDEHGYFFLARPVEAMAEGHAHDESESILDCRTFSASEIGRMIANNEIRDANTLSICARLLARGLLSFA